MVVYSLLRTLFCLAHPGLAGDASMANISKREPNATGMRLTGSLTARVIAYASRTYRRG
jgi:hypothetical protein